MGGEEPLHGVESLERLELMAAAQSVNVIESIGFVMWSDDLGCELTREYTCGLPNKVSHRDATINILPIGNSSFPDPLLFLHR